MESERLYKEALDRLNQDNYLPRKGEISPPYNPDFTWQYLEDLIIVALDKGSMTLEECSHLFRAKGVVYPQSLAKDVGWKLVEECKATYDNSWKLAKLPN